MKKCSFVLVLVSLSTAIVCFTDFVNADSLSVGQQDVPVNHPRGPVQSQPLNSNSNVRAPLQAVPASLQCIPYPQNPSVPPPACIPLSGKPNYPMPDRLQRPEVQSQTKIIPIEFRDAGPVKPIVAYSAGLVGSVVAGPFRLLELVFPLSVPSLGFPGPMPSDPSAGRNPAPTQCAAVCSYRPGEPCIAPLPQSGCTVRNGGPQLPPAVLSEYRFPPVEPQSLVRGIANFPFTIMEQGRVTGDIFHCTGQEDHQ